MMNRTLRLLTVILVCCAFASAQMVSQISTINKSASAGDAYSEISRFTGDNLSMFVKASGLANSQSGLNLDCDNSASAYSNNFASALFAPNAAPCNGVSVTSIRFSNATRTRVSGTDNTVGVVYNYPAAGTAPDGTVVDARVTVLSYNNNQDTNQNNFTDADLAGDETIDIGYDANLQPNINQESAQYVSGSNWNAQITYQINFYVTGTTTPKRLTVAATSLDNDGANTCGGLKETVTYNAGFNQVLINTNTEQSISGTSVTPKTTSGVNGISTDSRYASSALFVNVSQFTWSYSFATTGTCGSGSSPRRLGSLNLTCQIAFDKQFATVGLSGNVFNDTNGLNASPVNTVDGTGTNADGLFANLIDSNGFVVASVAVAATGTYNFPGVVAGNYNIQISSNQGVESSSAPVKALPANWVNTGEKLGTGAGVDGTVDGLLSVVVGSTSVTNANFGIQQRPTANNNTAASQSNLGGTNRHPVPAGTFSGSDTAPGNVASIRITNFPTNTTSITVGTTTYYANAGAIPGVCPTTTCQAFPAAGVTVPANASGNPTTAISVDPAPNGATTVVIPYRTIDNAGFEHSTTDSATASVPFTSAPTAANVTVSGNLFFNGTPLRNVIVTLIDGVTNTKVYARTNADGAYSFEEEAGKTYVVQPLSAKYKFAPSNKVVSLNDNLTGVDFASSAKNYRPKNDFDGDGKSDIAVYRQTEGNWYILNSGSEEMSVVKFGIETDVPVSGDFDADGKTDVAVYRPAEGNWYILGSSDQKSSVVRFGLADDKLVPADFDGDGKTDIAIYRSGSWYIKRSSDGKVEVQQFGLETDVPAAADYDADGKADIAVYRPETGVWYISASSNGKLTVANFGLPKDIPLPADYDGDGAADLAQFRDNFWYLQQSIEGFSVNQFGTTADKSIVGDYDGDGRADQTLFGDGIWTLQNSANGSIRQINFGLKTDLPIR